MAYQCKYCNTVFTKAYSMYKHQRTAKYCLQVQDQTTADNICRCGRNFTRKDALHRHQKTCAESNPPHKDSQLEELIKMITKLAEKPNYNVVMNMLPITDQDIIAHLEHLTIDFIADGAKGYADFAGHYPFKDRLVCTDKARKKLRYMNEDGELISDTSGLRLTQQFFNAITARNEELINKEYSALNSKVKMIAESGISDTANLTNLLSRATYLQEVLIKCRQAAQGAENEFTKEFVNRLSKIL